jgi:FKBP-type peptidyl-prolyl cis-trans isomerase FklB
MKKFSKILAISLLSLFIISSCGSDKKLSLTKLKNQDDSASYYLGLSYGYGIKQAKIDSLFNYNAFSKGVNAAVKEDTLPVSQQEMQNYLNEYFGEIQKRQVEKEFKAYKDENKVYLDNNAKKDSVVSLPSGLQYIILKQGTGSKPTMNDKIRVHYTGKLIDGTVFDSSYEENKPAEFIVGQVIPGWVEALQLMPVGSTWRVFIPEDLAYGIQPPRGSSIKPFATLIFDVELLDILPASAN